MDPEAIPRKTDKGYTEVKSRAFKVGHRERSVLIMVDGKTPTHLLLARLAFTERAHRILDELHDGGFIDVWRDVELVPVSITDDALERLTADASAPQLGEELLALRLYARNFVVQTLGPMGHRVAMKLEDCQSRDILMSLLEECRDRIAVGASRQKAHEFWNGLGSLAMSRPSTSQPRCAGTV
jgi:hypothetical protein